MLILGDPINMKYYYIAFYSLMQTSNIQMYNNTSVQMSGKVKVKCSRDRPGLPQRVGRGIALLFHDRGTRRG